jgi:magnesium chelatase family protein
MRHYGLSARAYDRICKVAWTMADLAETETITVVHLSEAMPYCTLDRA